MRTFTATTAGQNRLGLRELLQRYANEQWVANHFTREQAADAMSSTALMTGHRITEARPLRKRIQRAPFYSHAPEIHRISASLSVRF